MFATFPDRLLVITCTGGFGYFFTQHDDYVTLKQRITDLVLKGEKAVPEGVASIAVGLETLKLAEYLRGLLMGQVQ